MFQLPQRTLLKRQRDDDDDSFAAEHDHYHFEKKQRSDCFCPPPSDNIFQNKNPGFSQNRAHSPCLPALTPTHSDESGCDSPELSPYADTDMDDCAEDDYAALHSNPNSPAVPFMLPERLNPRQPHADPSTGRMPTPIYSHFPSKITCNEPSNIRTTTLEELRAASANARRSMAQRDMPRDMPSPIREDGMPLTPTSMTGNRLSRLHFYGSGDDGMDMDSPTFETHPSPESKMGRARSGALTGKKKFQMGFREDCAKCQARVPGHNAHFLPS